MSQPKQKPGKSEQIVCTPRVLLDAVEARFGAIKYDLACSEANKVCPDAYSVEASGDSLGCMWPLADDGLCYLNPPYGNITPWAKKAHGSSARIAMLVPASIGSNWFRDHVHGKAYVLALNPRVTFVGHSAAYPKDLILAVYGHGLTGFDVWRWCS